MAGRGRGRGKTVSFDVQVLGFGRGEALPAASIQPPPLFPVSFFFFFFYVVVARQRPKRSTNNQYVCKYIGCINDQSNWSGPFSLVVMTLDYRSRGTWFDPRSGHSTGIFSLQVYFSSTTFGAWCQDDYRRSPRAMQWQRSHKRAWE